MVARRRRQRRARGADGRRGGPRAFALALMQPVAPMLAQPADDIAEALARARHRRVRMEGRRRARAGAQGGRRRPRVHAQSQRRDGVGARDRRGAARSRRARADPRRRGDRAARRAARRSRSSRRCGGSAARSTSPTMRASLPLSVFFFDCLRATHDALIGRAGGASASTRCARALPPALLIPRIVTDDVAAAEAFYDDALRRGHEGVMAKSLVCAVRAGPARSVVAQGQARCTRSTSSCSRRSGATAAARAGCRTCISPRATARAAAFVMLGKTFKGMTDEMLAWQTREMLERETHRDDWTVYAASRTRRRDRVQRPAGEPALSRRARAALRARQALPDGQDARPTPTRSRRCAPFTPVNSRAPVGDCPTNERDDCTGLLHRSMPL